MRQKPAEIGRVDRECLADGVESVVKKRQSEEQCGKSLPPGQADASVPTSDRNFFLGARLIQEFFQAGSGGL